MAAMPTKIRGVKRSSPSNDPDGNVTATAGPAGDDDSDACSMDEEDMQAASGCEVMPIITICNMMIMLVMMVMMHFNFVSW